MDRGRAGGVTGDFQCFRADDASHPRKVDEKTSRDDYRGRRKFEVGEPKLCKITGPKRMVGGESEETPRRG